MDVVYVLRQSKDDNIDLRYSLRSLQRYFPHGKVFIVGYKPEWLTNVVHIEATDTEDKLTNVMRKLEIICKDKRISEDFVLMNDDFYFLKKTDDIPYYKLGTIKEYLEYRENKFPDFAELSYYKAIRLAFEQFPKGSDFSVHCPIVYNKKKLLAVLRKNKGSIISKRTLYCNSYGIKGVKLPNTPDYNKSDKIVDCKAYSMNAFKLLPGQPFISSDDRITSDLRWNTLINKLFPDMSKFELTKPIISSKRRLLRRRSEKKVKSLLTSITQDVSEKSKETKKVSKTISYTKNDVRRRG